MTPATSPLVISWTANRIAVVLCAAAALPVAAMAQTGDALAVPLGLAVALSVIWHAIFARIRKRPMTWDGIFSAMVFVLLVPNDVPLLQQAIAFSFGLVFGALIYGPRGRGFLSPVVVALAYLMISGAEMAGSSLDPRVTIAAGLSGVLLLGTGLVSWRLIAGFALTLGALALLWPLPDLYTLLTSASLIIGLVFLIADPVASCSTNPGRWLNGVLAAALIVLFAQNADGPAGVSVMVSAAFLASVFAPLLDYAVQAINIRRRARRITHD